MPTGLTVVVDDTTAGLGSVVMRALHNLYYLDSSELLYLDFRNVAYGAPDENIWNRFFHQPCEAQQARILEMAKAGTYAVRGWQEAGPWLLGYGRGHDRRQYARPEFVGRVRALVQKHLRFRPFVADAFAGFYAEHLAGKRVLGVHKRGSDQLTIGHGAGLYHVINPRFLRRRIDTALDAHNCDWIYLATDEQVVVNAMAKRYGGRIIRYPAAVAPVGVVDAVHNMNRHREPAFKHSLGRDMLIDALALSRTTHALLMSSNVSLLSLFLRHDVHYEFIDATFDYSEGRRAWLRGLPYRLYLNKVDVKSWARGLFERGQPSSSAPAPATWVGPPTF
jgi:hypothetical protein